MTAARLAFVPLDRIVYNPAINARRDTETDVAELAATIDTSALGQPLLLRAAGETFEPVDGGRRFRALKHLAATGRIDGGFEVPALIRDLSDQEALKLSLATAITRVDLNPADEAMSFADLVKGGASEEEIAATFGVPVRRVKQRLAIAALPDKIVHALRTGEIGIDLAQAFTVSRDAKQIETVFGQLNLQWANPQAVRNTLMAKRMSADCREAKYVGAEAYRAAGGAIDEDLFSNNAWFADGKLLMKLFEKKLKDDEKRWLDEGWSFVMIDTEVYGGKTSGWGWLEPEGKPSLTREQSARAKDLRAMAKSLRAALQKENRKPELHDLGTRLGAAEKELAALTEKHFTAAQMKKSGVLVKYNNGSIDVRFGIMKPAAAKKEAKAKASRQKARDRADEPSAVRGVEPEAEADFTGALQAEMAKVMTHAMQHAIVARPGLAQQLAVAMLMQLGDFSKPDGFIADPPQRRYADIHADIAKLHDEMIDPFVGDGGFNGLPKLFGQLNDHAAPGELVARSIAPLFNLGSLIHDELQPLIEAFDPDVSKIWEPDENFFKRMPMDSLKAALGEAAIPGVTPSKKKKELVAMALKSLNPVGWLPKPLRTPSYKGPGSNAWADAHAAKLADDITQQQAAE